MSMDKKKSKIKIIKNYIMIFFARLLGFELIEIYQGYEGRNFKVVKLNAEHNTKKE